MDVIFDNVWFYDAAFSYGIEPEIAFLGSFIASTKQRMLFPACGTGRYASAFACLGYDVVGFDSNPSMIDRACKKHQYPNLDFIVADMACMQFHLSPAFDSAFLLNNSLRYLLNRTQACNHFRYIHRVLIEGGIYVLELGLNDHAGMIGSTARWNVQQETVEVNACWTLERLDNEIATDKVTITVRSFDETKTLVGWQKQLIWDIKSLRWLVEETGFELIAAFNSRYVQLNLDSPDLSTPGKYFLVLKKKSG